jgi:hypothetical protein
VLNSSHHQIETEQEHANVPNIFAEHSTEQSKAAKVEEWQRLPLESDRQRRAWWRDRLGMLKRREEQKDFVVEAFASQETEHQWRGPSFSPNSTSPQRRRQDGRPNPQDVQQLNSGEYEGTESEEIIQPGHEASQAQFGPPDPLLAQDPWVSQPTVWQAGEGSSEGAHHLESVADNSHSQFLHSQRLPAPRWHDVAKEKVSPGAEQSIQNRPSSGRLSDSPQGPRRLSTVKWKKYF